MAVNAYERPAEQRFMDTYAPLPFQEIMAVGQAYQRERERTEQDIEQFMAEHSKFTSPSAIDAANYEALTKGVLDPQFQRMRMDPEWLRSQEGQAAIRGAIRSVDTGKLGMLRQSSEFLQERARNRAKLIAAGKYKESWDELADLSQYDTLSRGVLSDLSPMEYTSLHDIATPYAENLEPSFLGNAGRYYDWVGVDEEAIRGSINSQFDSILSTPQGQKWYKDIAAEMIPRGMTDANNIKEEMLNRLVQTQKDRVRRRKELNSARLQMDLVSEKANAKKPGSQTDVSDIPRYTNMITSAAISAVNEQVDNVGKIPRTMEGVRQAANLNQQLKEAKALGDPSKIEEIGEKLGELRVNTFLDNVRSVFYTGANLEFDQPTISAAKGKKFTQHQLNKGSKEVMDAMGIPNPIAGANAILGVGGTKEKDGSFTYNTSSSFVTPTQAVLGNGELGVTAKPNFLDDVLINNGIQNMKVTPLSGNANFFPSVDRKGNVRMYQRVKVSFTADDINLSGYATALSKRAEKASTMFAENVSKQTNARENAAKTMETVVKNNGGNVKDEEWTTTVSDRTKDDGDTSTTTTLKDRKVKTYTVELAIPFENNAPGSQVNIARINQAYLEGELTTKDRGGVYGSEVEDAFIEGGNLYKQNMQSAAEQDVINNMNK